MGTRDPLDSPSPSARQLTLNFEGGLVDRHRSVRDVMAVGVHRRGLVAVAGKIDMSPSKLSEKLGGGTPDRTRDVGLLEFERYLDDSGDRDPVLYLVEKYLSDPQVLRNQALNRIPALLETLQATLNAAGFDAPRAAGTRR